MTDGNARGKDELPSYLMFVDRPRGVADSLLSKARIEEIREFVRRATPERGAGVRPADRTAKLCQD